jgi:hypothetical protein
VVRDHHGRAHGARGRGVQLVPILSPPFTGYAEFMVNASGGAPPPVADHLLQEDGFDLLQESGDLILI